MTTRRGNTDLADFTELASFLGEKFPFAGGTKGVKKPNKQVGGTISANREMNSKKLREDDDLPYKSKERREEHHAERRVTRIRWRVTCTRH